MLGVQDRQEIEPPPGRELDVENLPLVTPDLDDLVEVLDAAPGTGRGSRRGEELEVLHDPALVLEAGDDPHLFDEEQSAEAEGPASETIPPRDEPAAPAEEVGRRRGQVVAVRRAPPAADLVGIVVGAQVLGRKPGGRQIAVHRLFVIDLSCRLPDAFTPFLGGGSHVGPGVVLESFEGAVAEIDLVDFAPQVFIDGIRPAARDEHDPLVLRLVRGRQVLTPEAVDREGVGFGPVQGDGEQRRCAGGQSPRSHRLDKISHSLSSVPGRMVEDGMSSLRARRDECPPRNHLNLPKRWRACLQAGFRQRIPADLQRPPGFPGAAVGSIANKSG